VIQLAKKGSFRRLASHTVPTPAFLHLFVRLSEEMELLQRSVRCSRARTSDHGMVLTRPARYSAMRCSISAAHASSTPSSTVSSMLSSKRPASSARSSAGSSEAFSYNSWTARLTFATLRRSEAPDDQFRRRAGSSPPNGYYDVPFVRDSALKALVRGRPRRRRRPGHGVHSGTGRDDGRRAPPPVRLVRHYRSVVRYHRCVAFPRRLAIGSAATADHGQTFCRP